MLKNRKLRLALLLPLLLGLGILLILQFIPVEKSNPPVRAAPNWDSPQTEALVRAACYDCHSNETNYPWYADLAPMRVLVRLDVLRGRDELNFSHYDPEDSDFDWDDLIEPIEAGKMPPWNYVLLHPEADLSESEQAALIAGLRATFPDGDDNEADEDDRDRRDSRRSSRRD